VKVGIHDVHHPRNFGEKMFTHKKVMPKKPVVQKLFAATVKKFEKNLNFECENGSIPDAFLLREIYSITI
jgi:hypothetical protein